MDSAAPMKPTGMPSTAAGRPAPAVDHLQQPEQRGRARCRSRPPSRPAGRATAPARRRCGWCPARRPAPGTRGSPQRADHLVAGRAAGARVTPEATICGVAQDRRAGAQRARGPAATTPGDAVDVVDQVDHAAGVDHADGDPGHVGGQPGQVGLGADGGERPRGRSPRRRGRTPARCASPSGPDHRQQLREPLRPQRG